MKNKVQALRETQNLTQSELAEKSGLSLRTIQRIEAGNTPKGFTLKSLASALETEPENLFDLQESDIDINRVKLINISALSFIILPLGNIIFPSILIARSKDSRVKELGKSILSIQIIWCCVLSISMIVSPFIQKAFSLKFPLFLVFLVTLFFINVYIIFKNGSSLSQKSDLYIKLKNNIL
ncbi:helix-turn-helix domain-containing protein [Chryseobacterium oryctis]|uniref:Helix-turn-helix domain-containing protein n=1 Tax=Chryseobacterium oryctis TaxID=2952618 RepID=A0ABT3HSR9_9FLAO|nr:helix-turn-helix domain-containing protein [Chryseobacterium oryctis]MCW3162831.1 helix-turn-helix domain-containing protein [Chryseobacterium oryctis]